MDTLKLEAHNISDGVMSGYIFDALSCSFICSDSMTQLFFSSNRKICDWGISIILTKEMIYLFVI